MRVRGCFGRMKHIVDQFYLYRIRSHQDAEAFGRIYDRYVIQIYRFVFLKLPSRETAEDVTSETFLKFWQYVLKDKEITNVRALLYKMARNLVVDYFRQAEPSIPLSVTFSDENTSSNTERPFSDGNRQRAMIEAKADLGLLLDKIGRLKDDFRDVLTLRLVDGLSYGDIAKILDKTPGHVRVIYHRAIKALEALDSPTPPLPTP